MLIVLCFHVVFYFRLDNTFIGKHHNKMDRIFIIFLTVVNRKNLLEIK